MGTASSQGATPLDIVPALSQLGAHAAQRLVRGPGFSKCRSCISQCFVIQVIDLKGRGTLLKRLTEVRIL